MPSIPTNRRCSVLGCMNDRSKFNSYCLTHGGRDMQKYRGKRLTNRMYNTTQWQELRQRQLSIQPLCAGCLSVGVITQAVHVDHVFPWTQIDKEAFYYNIFQSLCPSCHSSKTHLERQGTYRAFGKPSKDYVMSDYAQIKMYALKGGK